MGTSRNDRSPDVPVWRPALVALGSNYVPPERQIQEVWRAALSSKGELLRSELAASALPLACQLVAEKVPQQDALARFDAEVRRLNGGSFLLDLARRSLVRATGRKSDVSFFAADVFSEIAGYYVARDLPSFVGGKNRVQTSSEALKLKEILKRITREAALSGNQPARDGSNWQPYVREVLDRLAVVGGHGR